MLEGAREEARRALDINPDVAEALPALASALDYGEWNENERLIAAALEAGPAYRWTRGEYVKFLRRAGRPKEALFFVQRTIACPRPQSSVELCMAASR